MDFTFTEEQQAAAEAARGVFAQVTPDTVPSPALTRGPVAEDFDRALWRRLAAADLLGLGVPTSAGGAGLGPLALCLVLREAGRVLARVPLAETGAAALTLARYGDPWGLLPRIARGEAAVTVAAEGSTGHGTAELAVSARQLADGGWVLEGRHTTVPWGGCADAVLLPAHTPDGRAVLALVAPGAAGVTTAAQVGTDGEPLAELRLDRARTERVLAAEGAWAWLRAVLATGVCALALGVGGTALRMTAEYTGKREQFGHPLATFQAVAMQAADRYTDLLAMEATLWQAAWRLESGPGPAPAEVAVAKVWAAEGVRRVLATAQHLHGGFGADVSYALHRYHAWGKRLELALGAGAAWEEELGGWLAAGG
ncbi:acyl-CoA dehydrogenase family protein [Streptomyces orinoci]|uniref:Acyl-CoA dehydrogenase family protein n=1 Tax=Streptomyces orinoci TaxID=67339 RepID=A0ABV3K234_STRON|nr:acyl-CoA dehydrogenase family protein [Streptomyces orinoci]